MILDVDLGWEDCRLKEFLAASGDEALQQKIMDRGSSGGDEKFVCAIEGCSLSGWARLAQGGIILAIADNKACREGLEVPKVSRIV